MLLLWRLDSHVRCYPINSKAVYGEENKRWRVKDKKYTGNY